MRASSPRSGTGYGEEYEHKVSEAIAESLLVKAGFTGKLRMGNEVCIKSVNELGDLRSRLTIQNISGDFYLASTNYPKEDWKEKFSIDIADLKNWAPSISHYYPGGEVAVFCTHNSTYDLYADSTREEHIGNVDSIREGENLIAGIGYEQEPGAQP